MTINVIGVRPSGMIWANLKRAVSTGNWINHLPASGSVGEEAKERLGGQSTFPR